MGASDREEHNTTTKKSSHRALPYQMMILDIAAASSRSSSTAPRLTFPKLISRLVELCYSLCRLLSYTQHTRNIHTYGLIVGGGGAGWGWWWVGREGETGRKQGERGIYDRRSNHCGLVRRGWRKACSSEIEEGGRIVRDYVYN